MEGCDRADQEVHHEDCPLVLHSTVCKCNWPQYQGGAQTSAESSDSCASNCCFLNKCKANEWRHELHSPCGEGA